MIELSLAKKKDQARWDAYVLRHPDATPYHLFPWKKAVSLAYGHRCYYLLAEINGDVVGLLPLVHIKLFNFVNELVALPFCDVGSCLSEDSEIQDLLLLEAIRLKQKIVARKLSIRGSLQSTSLTTKAFTQFETNKVRMLLKLPPSSEELFAGFRSKLRSQIRKAVKNGITFRWGDLWEVDDFYTVFARNMHDLGSPVHSRKWLQDILRYYKNRARVGLVEFGNKIVGMGVILSTDKIVSIPWASTLREFNHLGPNMLLYWNFLKYSADNGYVIFDFGRSSEGEGTYKFKKQWGGQPEPLEWYFYGAGRFENNERKQLLKKDLIIEAWRKIPLGLANSFGPHLRRYISL